MGNASYVQASFLGGEWSQTALGNIKDPKYPISMGSSLNGFPMTTGAWAERSGTIHGGYTRLGQVARTVAFTFEDSSPYDMELTAGYLRFWAGPTRVTTNDSVSVTSISTATPAVVTLSAAVNWVTGNAGFFSGLNFATPLLQDRVFTLTKVDTTHFSLADEVTGTSIVGTGLGFTTGTLNRIAEVTTPYTAADVQQVRSVQTDEVNNEQTNLLHGNYNPQVLMATQPTSGFSSFALTPAQFQDGPYLDYFTTGVIANPNQTTGVVQLTLSFAPYVSTTVYEIGDFVTSSSANYQSLINGNIGNTPASNPSDWAPVSAQVAINNGAGFLSSDVGRLVRLYSEPPLWTAATSGVAGMVVTYNPTGIPGQGSYWQGLGSSSGAAHFPGANLTDWEPVAPGAALPSIQGVTQGPAAASGPAQWTWGQITSLLNLIAGNVSGVAQIGNMTSEGGLAAAFNGVINQNEAASASSAVSSNPPGATTTAYVGQNYTGTVATHYAISSATVFPATDYGLVDVINGTNALNNTITVSGTAYLYASNSAPSSYNNGTLLGSSSMGSVSVPRGTRTPLGTSPVSIASNDLTTLYKYVWVAYVITYTGHVATTTFQLLAAQVEIVNAAGSATSAAGVNVALLGPPLLYTAPISSWRLGAYSNTTGWPKCGTFTDGRLILSGAIANRVDGSYANGIAGTLWNFAPTDQYGDVTAANAFSYTFNLPDSNPVYWMEPEQQGIIAGTLGGEILISAPSAGGLSPLNIADKRVTKVRCANILPARTEHTLAFVQSHQRKLVEYFPDVFSGKFSAPDLSEKWKHLTLSGIAEIAYQQELIPIVWLRMNNGSLVGLTYKRDTLMTSSGPTISGAHRHTLGSGNSVVSICAGPSENGNLDTLSMVTLDSGGLYHMEFLSDLFEEGDSLLNAWFLDSGVVPQYSIGMSLGGSSGVNLNGLWHLNGTTATAFLGGLDCGDWPVANGAMSVPFYPGNGQTNTLFTPAFASAFSGAMPAVVGYTFTAQGQAHTPREPQETGARQGPAFGKKMRFHGYQATLVATQGISFGTSFSNAVANRTRLAQLKTSGGGSLLAANVLFSGVQKDTISDDPQGYSNSLCWQITRPLPAILTAIGGFLETTDE